MIKCKILVQEVHLQFIAEKMRTPSFAAELIIVNIPELHEHCKEQT